MLYFHEPDATGHDTDLKSKETALMVSKMDSLFRILVPKLQNTPVASQLAIIILSDHGMAKKSSKRTINLEDYTSLKGIKQEGPGLYALLYGNNKIKL